MSRGDKELPHRGLRGPEGCCSWDSIVRFILKLSPDLSWLLSGCFLKRLAHLLPLWFFVLVHPAPTPPLTSSLTQLLWAPSLPSAEPPHTSHLEGKVTLPEGHCAPFWAGLTTCSMFCSQSELDPSVGPRRFPCFEVSPTSGKKDLKVKI